MYAAGVPPGLRASAWQARDLLRCKGREYAAGVPLSRWRDLGVAEGLTGVQDGGLVDGFRRIQGRPGSRGLKALELILC